jgi:hypothetical protein
VDRVPLAPPHLTLDHHHLLGHPVTSCRVSSFGYTW